MKSYFSLHKKLEWYILPGRPLTTKEITELYNKTYTHWKSMWTEILNIGQDLTSESFSRQNFLCPLVLEGEVIGLIGCTFFNGGHLATLDHPYVRAFPKQMLQDFEAGVNRYFMSIEYLTVSPPFRKSELGVSLGEVLLGLSMKVFETTGVEFVLGTARSKIHVDEMCYKYGFVPFGSIDKFGHPCTLIINYKETLHQHPDSQTRILINSLWDRRHDMSQNTENEFYKKTA